MDLSFEHIYLKAEDLNQQSSPMEAYQELRKVMEYPGNMHGKDAWERAWYLFGNIAGALGFEKLSHLAIRAGDYPHDPKLLYNLGFELIEAQLPMIAATPLNQAHLMVPDNEAILTELTMALENAGMYDIAYLNLISSPGILEKSYLCRYLAAFNGIMSGHLEEIREFLPGLASPPEENLSFMRERISGFLQRADQIREVARLDVKDLRGWHYVLTGGLLLHLSPFGFEKPMRGRYAYVHDSYTLIREGIEKVRAAVQTWGVDWTRIVHYPNQESEILARALVTYSGGTTQAWTPDLDLGQAGLIVAYDLSNTSSEFLQGASERVEGQWVWSHAHKWTEDFPFTADFHTFMHQECCRPWQSGMQSEHGNGTVCEPSSIGTEEAIAKILSADLVENPVDDMEEYLAFAQAIGVPPMAGCREKYFHGSPVRSSRFA